MSNRFPLIQLCYISNINVKASNSLATALEACGGDHERALGWFEYCFCTSGRTRPVGGQNSAAQTQSFAACPMAVNVYEDWNTEDEFTVLRYT